MNAINICDLMILVIDAMAGIGPGTIRAWNQAAERNMPRMIFINGVDRDQVNFEATLEAVRNSYGATVCIPCTIPDGTAGNFKKVFSVLADDSPAEAEATSQHLWTQSRNPTRNSWRNSSIPWN